MTAERAEGGWVLDGTKLGRRSPADGIDEVAVVARAGDGVGAFVVPAAEAGLTPVRSLDASRPLSTATLTACSSPTTGRSGSPAARPPRTGVTRALQEATAALALETVGVCDALFQMVLSYVKDRKQFGVPIGSFQAVKHKMTNMFLAIERARSLCYFAVAAIDEDTPARATAVSMAKAASDDCQRTGVPGLAPVLRWHRVHLGARRPPPHQAGRVRRRALRGLCRALARRRRRARGPPPD